MAAYVIIDISICNPNAAQGYAEYIQKVRPIIEKHGGRYLARGGAITPIAGDWNPEKIVLLEFPSVQDIKDWWSSSEYKAIVGLREAATSARAIVVEGV